MEDCHSMARLFGTDGVRGVANTELTPELAFNLGRAGAYVLARHLTPGQPVNILVGKDTRLSGDLLESALIAGILSVGANAYSVGVLPTPAVAWLTHSQQMTAGVMISASHNPAPDNGIKFFAHDGYKLPDELEDEIEAFLQQPERLPRPAGDGVGRLYSVTAWPDLYIDYLCSLVQTPLSGLKVVVDCANGAVFDVAKKLFSRLRMQAELINANPDGLNINVACGSTQPQGLAARVQAAGADLGLAFDGDADRLIAVDHQGQVVNGDAIMAICALALQRAGRLANNTLVATVMSNMGLEQAMLNAGISLLRAPVGDRYVLAKMQEVGANLGGEQSGHIIFLDYATTGDGLLSALQLLQVVAASGQPLAQLASVVKPFPQVLHNVPVANRSIVDHPQVQQAISEAQELLRGRGRLVVRPSGTEPLIRVMAEAETEVLATQAVQMVARAIQESK